MLTIDVYFNHFNAALGPATLYGSAAWTNSAVQLTDAVGGQTGSVIFNGIPLGSYNSGFRACFNLQIGPTTTGIPADGVSFAVGACLQARGVKEDRADRIRLRSGSILTRTG